jgi:serine protease AprX
MRHVLRLCVPVLVSLALVPAAAAGTIDPSLASTASSSPPATPLPVIVYGRGLGDGSGVPGLVGARQLDSHSLAGTVAADRLAALAAAPGVAFVAPDEAIASLWNGGAAPAGTPGSGSSFDALDGATTAWSRGYTGAGVAIAVVDSGAGRNNDLGGRLVATTGGYDQYGHGTIVTSVAAGLSADGRFSGVAPGATVIGVNVAGSGQPRTSDVIAGLLWVLANKDRYAIRVVNISLAETATSSYATDALDATVERLWEAGVVVVAAAGNGGPGAIDYAPANDPFAVTVGATDADTALTSWSAYGTTVDGFAKPELVAPGRLVVGFLPWPATLARQAPDANWVVRHQYAAISGTSFSAPQVAGAAAVLLQEHPDWTPDQVKWVLETSTRPVDGSAAGALDLAAATAYAGTPPAANDGVAASPVGLDSWLDALAAGADLALSKQNTWTLSQQNTWTQSTWTQSTWTAEGWR